MDFLKSGVVKIFIGVIAVSVIVIIVISIVSGLGKTGTADEKALISAAKKYFNTSPVILPKSNYESATVTLDTLIDTHNIKAPKDKTCFSYVTVTKSGDEYIYSPYAKCNEDSDTKLLIDKIHNNVTTTNDGVYKVNDEYIYKGEDPNNYVKFSDELWRIIKADKDGIIKVIYSGENTQSGVWDDRFNLNTNNNTGINEYKVSRIYSSLKSYINDSNLFSNTDRAKLAFVNLCIGKRSANDTSTNGAVECASTFEKQMIGLLQTNEYFNASNDPNCSPASAQVCQNYNYLAAKAEYWTMTAVADNTNQIFKVYPYYGLQLADASDYQDIYPVLYFKKDTAITGGTGTATDPYVLR